MGFLRKGPFGVAFHNWEVERQKTDSKNWDIKQSLFNKELQHRNFFIQDSLQDQNISPTLMVADHQIPFVPT